MFLRSIILPAEITDVERRHLARINRAAFAFFAMHIPVFALLAWFNDTGPGRAVLFSSALLIGPALAHATLKNPRSISVVYGVTSMLMGGLLVHFGQGPVQIEMHFYFFALLAMLAVYGNPMVILAAAATVALHHLILWAIVPKSVFNYDAPVWVVAVHAAFVVLESVATCFIARSFFDNVIGLEKIVKARTEELDRRNDDMRVLLDNVGQGFFTIDRDARISKEHSAILTRWFGEPESGATLSQYLATVAPLFATETELSWEQVTADLLPADLALWQMPRRFEHEGHHYDFAYSRIGDGEVAERFLVVVSDVTSDVARKHAERDRQETMSTFEHMLADRAGFMDFVEEAASMIDTLASGAVTDAARAKRILHTLKGNSAIFGFDSVAETCHELEEKMADDADRVPDRDVLRPLLTRWSRIMSEVDKLIGLRSRVIEVTPEQHTALEDSFRKSTSLESITRMVHELKLEPTERRLKHFAEQAKRIGERLDKPEIVVEIADHGLRLDGREWIAFWSAFVHAIRNAVDHGLESPDDRVKHGKSAAGRISLRTFIEGSAFVVEIADDGRGIDWDALRTKARDGGLPFETKENLVDALFVDGISTAAQVTEVSGRGVGMGALRAATTGLGGKLLVDSRAGAGTTLRMSFPMARMDPDLHDLLRGSRRDNAGTSAIPLPVA